MAKEPESIQYIRVGGVDHPIDAVSVNGRTLPSATQLLPSVTSIDEGKILMVLLGQWGLFAPDGLYDYINGIVCPGGEDSESEIPIPPHDYSQDYLTLDILTSGTVKWNAVGSGSTKTVQYSLNGGDWTSITSTNAGVTINVSMGDTLRFKGTNSTYALSNTNYSGFGGGAGTTGTATFDVSGNAMSLIYGDNFVNQTTLTGEYNLCCLFDGSNAVSAENLILPAMTLTPHCYRAMFANCSLFTTPPALPATTLADSCYRYMFNVDGLMTSAPELPAQTLATLCYYGMFNQCSSLNYIKCLATDISASRCTEGWVHDVDSTGTFIKAGSMNGWTVNSINGIPIGWTVISEGEETISVEDPLISCFDNYVYIFCDTPGATIYYRIGTSGNFSLYTTSFEIFEPVRVEAYAELSGVHSNTSSYNCEYIPPYIPDEGDSDSDTGESEEEEHDYSKDYLTLDVLTSGTLLWKSNGSNATKTIQYSINDGVWTSVTSTNNGVAINVSAGDQVRLKGTETRYCNANKANYSGFDAGTATFNISGNIMSLVYGDNFESQTTLPSSWTFTQFFKQSSPVSAENMVLPATTMLESCYRAMFSKCTTLEVPPKILPAMTLGTYCYYYMFENCSITAAPELPAPTLANYSYAYMFTGCSHLCYIKCLATTKSASNCLTSWVNNVSPTGTFIKDNNTTWSTGVSGIPTGWVVNDAVSAAADPEITCDGEFVTITCDSYDADIYYRLNQTGEYVLYTTPFKISVTTIVEAYAINEGGQSNIVSETCEASTIYRFAGLELTQGPLYYGTNGYEIKNTWNTTSYNTSYGKTSGSTFFNFLDLGELFESSIFSTSDGSIDNELDPLGGWRLPTSSEWSSIIGTTRSGATVNNTSGQHYAVLQLTGVSYAGSSTPTGILLFPDDTTITGTTLANTDSSTPNTGITSSQLDEYLNQGCVFLPAGGYYSSSWSSNGEYWSSSEYDTTDGNFFAFAGNTISNTDKEDYLPVHLVRDTADIAVTSLKKWSYNGNIVETPYSVNGIQNNGSTFSRGSFTFNTSFKVEDNDPVTQLWFQHADQSADIYINGTKATTHWGGYTAFTTDVTEFVHPGENTVSVTLNNTTRSNLAPCAGDFNFCATLGNVKVLSSPVVPDALYGYDGFHVTSTVTDALATITVTTSIPTTGTVTCSITGTNCNYTDAQTDTGVISFTTSITNPHLWNGTLDPYLYDINLTISKDGVLYHKFHRAYGLRYFEYVINQSGILQEGNYTGFLLNGSPYLLRGVCMHHDKVNKANALTAADVDQDFEIIKELGCNFIRLAHYPHPKEVYEHCDKLGIIVQTEAPWVNNARSTQPSDYYTHLEGQFTDMVTQYYNHPSIVFWGLANEITTDDATFAKTKVEGYRDLIRTYDTSRMVGYVISHSYNNPSSIFNNPNMDWFGGNIYVGWYISNGNNGSLTNDPSSHLTTRINNIVNNRQKPLAFSEYGCGGTQHCHSEDPQATTTKGNLPRHDIEYQMWLHEGHLAAIRNFPELIFTGEWQLFDITVTNRNEGYTICLDGENTSTDDNLKRLNNKGLVERDHITKKDTFYLYKAEWSSEIFTHICQKDYIKNASRVIKCYTNDTGNLSLYVNNVLKETLPISNHMVSFSPMNFSLNDVVRVDGTNTSDTFTFTQVSDGWNGNDLWDGTEAW